MDASDPADLKCATHLVGVDVGGTFTDVLVMSLDGSAWQLAKVPSTEDPADAVVAGVLEAARRCEVDPDAIGLVLNGTTIVTNTVVEAKGARVGLLVTRGYRYVLEIARSWTPGPVSGWMVWDRPAPLADTRDVVELSGRLDARGQVRDPIDEDEVRVAVRTLAEAGVEALSVALLNGYANPEFEARVGELAREAAPGLPVTLASVILPEFREYERTLAAVANAYVQPAMRGYVASLEAELRARLERATVNIVRSDGGVMSGADAGARPIETVFSGPAGGVRAAVFLGELIGQPRRALVRHGRNVDRYRSQPRRPRSGQPSQLAERLLQGAHSLARRDRHWRGWGLDRARADDRRAYVSARPALALEPRARVLRPRRSSSPR